LNHPFRNARGLLRALTTALLAATLSHNASASHTPAPSSVTIAGSMQSEAGCPGDWNPACATTHLTYVPTSGLWRGVFALPADGYTFKAALNDSWGENYGLNGQNNGTEVPLAVPAPQSVRFYYDHNSHWVTSSLSATIATAAGSFQSELGCPGDWQPDCLKSLLQVDGDGIYTFETAALPAGNYEAKVAIDESWDENYGANGVLNGATMPFSVPASGRRVVFAYNAASHILTITVDSALGVSLTNTPVIDPDGAGPLAPVALPPDPSKVVAGGYIRHDAAFVNADTVAASNVVVTLQLAAGETFVGALATGGVFVPAAQPPATPFSFTLQATVPMAASITFGCTVTGQTLATCSPQGNVDLPAGAAGTLTIFGRVDPGTVKGQVLVSNAAIVPAGPASTASAATTVAGGELTMALTNTAVVDPDGAGPLSPVPLPAAPPGAVASGGYVRYDATFANIGDGPSSNTSVTLQLPAETTFVGALATGGVFVPAAQPPASPFVFTMAAGATSLTCTVTATTLATCVPTAGTLPAGATGTLTMFGRVQPATPGGTVLTATANILPPGPQTTSTATIVTAALADLSITNVDVPDPVTAGSTITYTLNVTNAGPSLASGIAVTFPLDGHTMFVSASGAACTTPAVGTTGVVNCSPAALASGTSVVLTIVVAVDPAFAGIAAATATVSSAASDSNPGNNSATATTTVNALTFVVTGVASGGSGTITCASPVQYGQTTTCTITPLNGASIVSIAGCGGIVGNSSPYVTGPITAACTVSASLLAPSIPALSGALLALLALLLAALGVMQGRRR